MDAAAAPRRSLPSTPGFVSLAALPPGTRGHVVGVGAAERALSALERRLLELGFVSGERVEILAEARPGRDPFVVRVGHTTLALRRREAQNVWVEDSSPHSRAAAPMNASDGRGAGRAAAQPVARRRPQLRQDRAVQSSHRQPPEGRQLPGRHRRAQGRPLRRPAQRPRSTACSICPAPTACEPTTLDEAITRDVVLGRHATEPPPDLLVCVVDATNLRLNLRLVLDLKRLGRPDDRRPEHERRRRAARLSARPRRARARARRAGRRDRGGAPGRRARAGRSDRPLRASAPHGARRPRRAPAPATAADIEATQREVRRILEAIGYRVPPRLAALARLDAVVLHPIAARCCWRRCCF